MAGIGYVVMSLGLLFLRHQLGNQSDLFTHLVLVHACTLVILSTSWDHCKVRAQPLIVQFGGGKVKLGVHTTSEKEKKKKTKCGNNHTL